MQLSLFPPEKPSGEKPKPVSGKMPGPALLKVSAPDQGKAPKPDPRVMMKARLLPHLPEESIGLIIEWLIANKVQLRISRTRSTKLGDYRSPRPGSIPKISVNQNLNKYSFLITLVHEMAHHAVFISTGIKNSLIPGKKLRVKPHGSEWKSEYGKLIQPFLNTSIFPPEILSILAGYFENPRASSTADQQLSRILKSFDKPNGKEILENLPADSFFHLPDGRKFQKKEKIRTRYRCLCMKTKRVYLFNPLAEVYHL